MDSKVQLPKGTKLHNRYVIENVVGNGGFGITYCAFDTLLNRLVAIKEFYTDKYMTRDVSVSLDVILSEDEGEMEKIHKCHDNFLREIKIMKVLQNVPYISRIRDSFYENGTEYIVMNLLRGQTLSECAKKKGGIMRPAELLPPLEHVLIALEEMHALGFVHRDISPGNLFLTKDGDLYLIDFGTASTMDETSELRNNQIFEHKGFQAPEFKEIDKQGVWTDIYSLCATIVYLVTGEGVQMPEERIKYDAIPALLTKSALSTKQQNAILQGLNLDIARRYHSVKELRNDLCGELAKAYFSKEVSYCAGTNIGSRAVNQDNLMVDGLFYYEGKDFVQSGTLICKPEELHMVAVCDGIGGANAGELASRAAAQALNHFIKQYRTSEVLPERLILELMDQINEKIVSLGKKIGKTGTTVSFLLWYQNQYYAVNIGDSPIFLLRKRKLKQIGAIQTLARKKELEGKTITIKDCHTLVNYLGKDKIAGSQMAVFRHGYLQKGDTFLVCSDGVTDQVNHDRLKRYLLKSEERALKAINKAIAKNVNNDNYTAVIVRF
ncbi:MAG: protein phosphatase 2C domain-containing protein [Lachnospiraceae bacterium]|nr:protein phosphatase 2C domain-containing protein [Lachnospiraceae bacterium]